jgi:hypothetical protein
MSDVYHAPPAGVTAQSAPRVYEEEAGSGWVMFAGTMILILGAMNVIYGIAAIDDSTFYVQDAKYVFSDLNTWGWVLLVVGVTQVLVGFGIWARIQLARWLGVLAASVNAILQLIFLPASPFLALALFSIGILVIYGLLAHGQRSAAA